jgi:hypothetical protein
VVRAQDSPGDDLCMRVFNFCPAGTISDWTNGDVARVCHVGTELETVYDAGAQTGPSTYYSKKSVPKARSFAVKYLRLNFC